MSDSDKQALLDGTATIETRLEFHNENLFDYEWFYENCEAHSCTKSLIGNGIKLSFTAGADAFVGEARNSTNGTTPALQAIAIKVAPNTTYTLSASSLPKCFLTYMDSNKDVINTEYISIPSSYDETSYTFTTPSNVEYIGLRFGISNNQYTEWEFTDVTLCEEPIVLDQNNSVIKWDYEDFRYVKDEGWIGQFVARQVTGELKNISDDFNITDREFILKLGVRTNDNTNWYSLGNFLITKITDDEVKDKTSFEALDYTKKFNKVYEDTITYPCTALQLAQNVCEQCGVILETTDFTNNEYVIEGNVFTNNETCRDVMKAIGKLAFSWVRIDWDNKVYIDFEKLSEISEYDRIDNTKYYNLKTQKESFGEVNRVIIGYSQIEGERTKIEDAESIEENGVYELTVYDNPLVYTQEQREQIIDSANYLLGLSYAPLNTLTVGHPWLKGKELIEIVDMEGNIYDTIPFDRTIQYFGHIKTLIDVNTNTKTDTKYAYDSNIGKNLKTLTEIQVDKINKQITEIIEETLDDSNPDSLITKLSQSIRDIDSLKNIFQITGGSNLIKNSQFMFTDEVWTFTDGTGAYHTPLGEGYNPSLIGTTTSAGEIKLRNTIITTTQDNIDNLVKGQTYTLNYSYRQDNLTTTTVRLIDKLDNSVVFEKEYDEQVNYITNDEFQFVADYNHYVFEVETETISGTDGYFYLYDLMLNSGDKKTWEPAMNEVYSTVIKMSQEGLQVMATGSNIITLLTARGFQVRKFINGAIGDIITEFTDIGLVTGIMKSTETHIGHYIMTTLTINGKEHHVEYFGGE